MHVSEEMIERAQRAYNDTKYADDPATVGNPFPAMRAALLSALAPVEPVAVAWITNCCVCRRIVDKRESSEGGDPFGAEDSEGRWTCSVECWDASVSASPVAPPSAEDDLVAALEAVELWWLSDGMRIMEKAGEIGAPAAIFRVRRLLDLRERTRAGGKP